jgi:hypothetical protein
MFFLGGNSEKGAVLAPGEQITYPILVTVPSNITPGTHQLSAYITYRLQFQNGTWTGSLVALWVINLQLAYPPTQQNQTTTGGESPQASTNIETVGILVAVVAIGLFLERARLIRFIGKHRVTKPGQGEPGGEKPKPVDQKPVDQKPVDQKPVDQKPVDQKLVDQKLVDQKLVDQKEEEDL